MAYVNTAFHTPHLPKVPTRSHHPPAFHTLLGFSAESRAQDLEPAQNKATLILLCFAAPKNRLQLSISAML